MSRCFDAGGGGDSLNPETVGGDDAVVKDVFDVGLGGDAAQGGGVVILKGGLGFDGGDAEVFVAVNKVGARGRDAGFGVSGDGGVAIEDEVAMRCDARGVDLSTGRAGEEDREDEGSVEQESGNFSGNRDRTSSRDAKSRRRKIEDAGNGHGGTSLLR